MNWHSYHIFIHDLTYHDHFLIEYLQPFIRDREENIQAYFFIRYWQGGPHLRFRFKAKDEKEIQVGIKELLEKFQLIYKPSFHLTREEYYKNHKFDGEELEESDLYWMEDLTIAKIDYEAEYDRYGGKEVMEDSEAIFQITSDLAFERLRNHKSNPSVTRKLIDACDFFFDMRGFLTEEKDTYILENYERFWSSFQEEGQVNEQQIRKISALFNQNRQLIHQSLNKSGKTHIEEIEEIFKGIKEKGKEEVIPYIIFSHIHMFNNRIGLPSYLETSLASIMKETNRGVNNQ